MDTSSRLQKTEIQTSRTDGSELAILAKKQFFGVRFNFCCGSEWMIERTSGQKVRRMMPGPYGKSGRKAKGGDARFT